MKQQPVRKIESFGDMIVVERDIFLHLKRHPKHPTERESEEETQFTPVTITKSSSIAEVQKLLSDGKEATTHPAKLHAFSRFVENVYGTEIRLIPGIEKRVGSQIFGMRGSIDLLFSHVILEFKTNFDNEIEDGKLQLIKYFQLLYDDDPEAKYVGMLTDCIKYAAFVPEITNGKITSLNPLETIKDISLMDPREVIQWIDSFLFSKSGMKPTALDLTVRFGPGSPTHKFAINELANLQKMVKSEKDVQLKMTLWLKNMEIVYGSQPVIEAFIDHTYLVTIVKILVYLRLSGARTVSSIDIKGILTGKYFVSHGILNLIEEDYFSWILDPNIMTRSLQLGMILAGELRRYDLSQVEEDLFKEIYQTIVRKGERQKIGEYYTPEWVSEISLTEAISTWRKEHSGSNKIPRILDPACGSGTFLTNAIRLIRSELSVSKSDLLNSILDNVIGMDVNPLAVVISRANYII
jgi:hypothetical protein